MATQPPNANPPTPWRASAAARWLAAAAAGGSALLIASYFMVWEQWAIPASDMVSGKVPPPVVPVERIGLFQGLHGGSALPYALVMFALPVMTALGALIALVAPRWSRVTLTLLGALAAVYSLSQSLGAFSPRLIGAPDPYVADIGAYVGVSASLLSFCGASGLLFIALAEAWRALRGDAPRARIVTRRWAGLVASGAALLIASYFMPWRHDYLPAELSRNDPAMSNSAPWPLNPAPEGPHMPLDISGLASIAEPYRAQNLIFICLIFLVPPALAMLAAFFALSGPRWNRVTWSFWSALMGAIVLLVSLGYLMLSGFTGTGVSTIVDLGAYIGLGASILIVVAAAGLVFATLNSAQRAPAPGPQL